MSSLPGKFVWLEHHSNDIAKARAFYEKLFGWHVEQMPMGTAEPYSLILNGGAGIGGFATAASGAPASWLSYLSVDDVDAAHEKAIGAGAKSLMAPMDYGTAGRAATIADPTGAALSLWKGAQGDPADTETTPVGALNWNELSTQDPQRALAFYEAVFGFTHDEMAMLQGTYYMLKTGSKARGGVMKSMHAGAPALWMQYITVDDCDAAVARAKSLGATIFMPPMDVDGVGRFAGITDPQGAMFGIIKAAPTGG